jgi:5-methylthioadenosine/S-adenosylhomocysteine deaminase
VLRVHARWVVPITAPPIEDGTVAIDGDRIGWVGPRREAPAGDDLDAGNCLLMPGLVNAHTHLELTTLRGAVEEVDFPRWIRSLVRARRGALNDAHLYAAACRGIAEGLSAGITTFADTCDSGVVLRALRDMGARGIMYQEVFGPDPADCDAAIAGLREKVARHRSHETQLARVGVSPHAAFSVSDQLFAETCAWARAERLPIAIHAAESADETALVRDGAGAFASALRRRGMTVRSRGRSPIEMLERAGALGPGTLLIHCVAIDDADIAMISRAGCAIAHCPASNAKLGHGIAPVAELLAAGVDVALGSDSVASNNRMDILEEARLAVMFQRARLLRGSALSAQAALELATIGGARALGLEGAIGSIEVGKSADLAAFSLAGPTGCAVVDPIATAVFSLTGRDAELVMVAGRVVVRDRTVVAGDSAWVAGAVAGEQALAIWREKYSASYH